MKKILSIVLSAMVCLCFAGCDFLSELWKGYVPPSNGPTPLTYYGVIEEQEESGALFVYIDGIGLCDIPHYAEGNMTEINVKVGVLIVAVEHVDSQKSRAIITVFVGSKALKRCL